MKLEIPKHGFFAQDKDGYVNFFSNKPFSNVNTSWRPDNDCDCFYEVIQGKPNPNWRDTRINLEVDDYEFEDGILRRVER